MLVFKGLIANQLAYVLQMQAITGFKVKDVVAIDMSMTFQF